MRGGAHGYGPNAVAAVGTAHVVAAAANASLPIPLPSVPAMNNLFGSDSWLYIILVGFVVGLLARFITPGTQRLGCLLTIVLGIAGAVVASWFGRYMGWYHAGEPAGFLGAFLGAIAILALLRLFSGSKR